MIKTGRYGTIKWDPTGVGTSPTLVVALNTWKLDQKTDKKDVTCFNDPNRVYVPGMKDLQGSLGGFWDIDEPTLFEAADQDTPGFLELSPNSNEAAKWSGKAYLDASIDCGVEDPPKVSGSFMAAGPWTLDTGALLSAPDRIRRLEEELAALRRAA